jgi:hypothetical protein
MPRGRPRKIPEGATAADLRAYRTPAELKKKMQAYFDSCREDGDVFPDEAGMRIYLNLTKEEYQEYLDDKTFNRVTDWAEAIRESWAARGMANNPRNAAAFLAILKQPANGGWVDRRPDKGGKRLIIDTSGVGGDEAFRKIPQS